MSSPAPVDVSDALDDLVNQFADPMSFFRELIQNALDAGSAEVDVDFEFEASGSDPEAGAMVVIVTDYGEGMDREIIDTKLTRLFSSAKDGDMTKIGKFGIGFVSVFAIQPDAVCVDTARAGEAWRLVFKANRTFSRLRLDQAMEGTTIRIIKNMRRPEFDAFVVRARQVVRYWCGHAQGEVRFQGERLSEPFGLDAAITVDYRDDFSHVFIGHRHDHGTLHAFFNGGLTLVQADQHHGSAVQELIGLSFKVSSRYLEHTLTRDDVIKDGHFSKVVARLHELARGPLRNQVFERIDAAVRATPYPTDDGAAAKELQLLYEAAAWHLRDHGGIPRALTKLGCARSPSGRIWTWAELRGVEGGLLFCSERTPVSDAVEALGLPVVLSYGGVNERELDDSGDPKDPTNTVLRALISAAELVGSRNAPAWLGRRYFMPLAPEPSEQREWAALANMVAQLLDGSGYKIAGACFGRFAESGSLLGGRPAISQREFGEATLVSEAGELGTGLFSRRRMLVIDADHPTVRVLLGLAVREVELASYQLVKLFLLLGGSISAELDSKLADLAMGYREARCPLPMR